MKTLPISVLSAISAGAWLPSFDAQYDVVLPKEIALGTITGIFAMHTFEGSVAAASVGFLLGWIAIPAYHEAAQGFPHFKGNASVAV